MGSNSVKHGILWFQHLHKCAGSSVIAGAEANGLTFYPNNANGNPQDESGQDIELWKLGSEELSKFLDHVRDISVSFIATEWGGPCFETLRAQNDVRLVTVIRKPFDRLRSNYLYDISAGFSKAARIEDYMGSAGNWTLHNYYTRIFSRYDGEGEVTEDHLETAICAMELFDDVFLQDRELQSNIARRLGWNADMGRRNKTPKGINIRMMLWSLRRGNLGGIWRSLRSSREISDQFKKDFLERNQFDLRLYARAVELASQAID